jgi:hypothetical protein
MSADIPTLTFVHRFGSGVTCTMRVDDKAPVPGTSHIRGLEWEGRPKPKHFRAYRQWILVTTQFLCDRWQARILYCLGTKPNETELWQFESGKPPKLAEKLNIGIP